MNPLIIGIIIATLVGVGILVYCVWNFNRDEPRDVNWRISAAKKRAIKAKARARDAAKKGVIGRIQKSIRENPNLWGFGLYGWFSLLGMSYSWSFYSVFDIDIFHFAALTDFLLFALSEATLFTVLIIIVLSIILVSLSSLLLVSKVSAWIAKVINWVYEFVKSYAPYAFGIALLLILSRVLPLILSDQLNDEEGYIRALNILSFFGVFVLLLVLLHWFSKFSTWIAKVINRVYEFMKIRALYLSVLLIVILTTYFSLILGQEEGKGILGHERHAFVSVLNNGQQSLYEWIPILGTQKGQKREPQSVRVTIRQDAAQTRLPNSDRTLLLGTTSSFHFFYECGETLIDKNGKMLKNTDGTPKKCEEKNGQPFIIPTANIASLEFNPTDPTPDSPIKKKGKDNGANGPPKVENPQHTCGESEPTCGEIESITHFSDARHDELEALGKEKLENLLCKMTGRFQDYRLQELRLTGRADNRQLVGQALEEYGSNENLATKRAEWIRDELIKKFEDKEQKKTLKRVIPLKAGPRCTDPDSSKCDRALDRAVEVYACWTPKPKPKPASPAESPPDPATAS